MSVLDLFSASPGVRAAGQAARKLGNAANQGFGYVTNQLGTGYGDALNAIQNYGGQAIDTAKQYGGQAVDAVMGGTGQQVGAYQQGIAPWQKLFEQYAPGAATYWNALGVPDPGGNVAGGGGSFGGGGATSSWGGSPVGQFQHSPGYDETYRQGIEAAARTGQQTGQLGAANMDAMTFAHNLSNQDYQQWLGNLAPSLTGQQRAAQGIQEGENQVGDAYGNQGANIAKLLAATGSDIAGYQSGLGGDISGLDTGLATNLANAGNAYYNKKGDIKSNMIAQKFGARQGANQNALSALFGVGNLLMAPMTGGTSILGSVGRKLGGLFGQPTGTGAYDSMMQGSGFMDNAGNIY